MFLKGDPARTKLFLTAETYLPERGFFPRFSLLQVPTISLPSPNSKLIVRTW